jgi:hypothetical protein
LLLTHYLDGCTSAALSDWLRDIGEDSRGSVEQKRERIRAHTKYLAMPAADFPEQTRAYLALYAVDDLADLCERLGLSADGTRDALTRRIFREIHHREGWIARLDPAALATLTAAQVMPFLGWMPLNIRADLERDFYPVLADELTEVFDGAVFEQLPVAHGSTLKIDFHVGDPQGHGVGIEVKMPHLGTARSVPAPLRGEPPALRRPGVLET